MRDIKNFFASSIRIVFLTLTRKMTNKLLSFKKKEYSLNCYHKKCKDEQKYKPYMDEINAMFISNIINEQKNNFIIYEQGLESFYEKKFHPIQIKNLKL